MTMKLMFNRIVIAVLTLLVSASAVHGGKRHEKFKNAPIGIPGFSTDYTVFFNPSRNVISLELFAGIPYNSLYTFKEDGKEISRYEMAIIIRDRKGKQVTGTSWQNRFENPYDLKYVDDRPLAVLEKKLFELERNKYLIEFNLTDLVSNLKSEKTINLNLNKFKSPILLSGIEFTMSERTVDSIIKSDFIKNGLLVIPAASRRFDSEQDKPGYYFEIYPNINTPDILAVEIRIEAIGNDETVFTDTMMVVVENRVGGLIPVSGELAVDRLRPGQYELKLELKNSDFSKKLAERQGGFVIDWSLKTLVENDYSKAVDQLRYIAVREERDMLRKAKPAERLNAISKFWEKRDPTPSTPQNELREEYYARVRYATDNFSAFGRPGYLTDLGRVYITYGKPEEIERHPFEIDSKPYEIWYYYRFHRKFIFVDKNGYGYYELAYSHPDGLKM